MITMAEARAEHDWSQTSALLALIANAHRTKKMKAFTPDDFNPVNRAQEQPKEKADFQLLKQIFVPRPRITNTSEHPCDTPSDNSPSTGCRGSSAPSSS